MKLPPLEVEHVKLAMQTALSALGPLKENAICVSQATPGMGMPVLRHVTVPVQDHCILVLERQTQTVSCVIQATI